MLFIIIIRYTINDISIIIAYTGINNARDNSICFSEENNINPNIEISIRSNLKVAIDFNNNNDIGFSSNNNIDPSMEVGIGDNLRVIII